MHIKTLRLAEPQIIQITLLCYAALALTFLFNLGLTEQEAYYWLWSKKLDWSYFDHPPLQAWITSLLCSIGGDNKWIVRLPAAIGELATFTLFYQWTKQKWGQSTAFVYILLLASSLTCLMGSIIALPDSFAVPLGLTTIIFAERGDTKKTGIFLGLALLAKWTVLFILPGVIYQFYRKNLISKRHLFYLLIPPLTLQAPVIWWNIQHDAASVIFHLYSRHSHEFLNLTDYLINFGKFILSQLFSIGIVTTFLLTLLFLKFKHEKTNFSLLLDWRSVIFWSAPGLFVVFISALQGQLRFYWTFLSLLPAIAHIGCWASIYLSEEKRLLWGLTIAVIFVNWSIAAIVSFYPLGDTIESVFHLKHDLRHSPIGEISRWRPWLNEEIIPNHLLDSNTAFIGSDLHIASKLSWALRNQSPLSFIGVIGQNRNQFQFWNFPDAPQYSRAIFFADNRYDKTSDFQQLCGHKLAWITTPSKLHEKTVREIFWSYCSSYLSRTATLDHP